MNLSRTGKIAAANLIFTGSLLLLVFLFSGFFAGIDNWLHDLWLSARLRFNSIPGSHASVLHRLAPVVPVNEEITLILIDDRSILGIPGLFQGDRDVYATAIRKLTAHGPKVIALDVFFASQSEVTPELDQELVDAVKESGRVVLRAFRRDDRRMTPPFPALSRATICAPTYFKHHRDEAIRSVSMAFTSETGKSIPSFQAETYRLFKGLEPHLINITPDAMFCQLPEGQIAIPLVNSEYMLLNYDLPLHGFRTYSFFDLMNGGIPEDAVKNRAVIIGAASSMTEEKFYTPISGNEYSPYLNALTLRNMLNQRWLEPPASFQGPVLATILILIFMFVLLNFLQPLASLLVTVACVILLLSSSFVSLTLFGKLFDVAAAVFSVTAALIFSIGHRYYLELSEKMRIKTAFQHYVTASVVNEILKNPAKLNLHGEERNLTIFFSDIEGFTSLSEGMSPLNVVSLLNEYLTAMTEIIFRFDGLLDKYEGDAIMAVFGAPVDQSDHAIRACRCAIENQKALARLREKWKKEGKPEIRARIGINTGVVVVGNMGSTMRFDYTVIGDNVNLAARLETGNKIFNTEILVSQETATLAESAIISRRLARLKVAGKTNLVNVYEVLADRSDPDPENVKLAIEAKQAYETAADHLLARNFAEAEKILNDYLATHPTDRQAATLHSRVKGFQIVPPPAGWENVVTQDIK